MTALVAVGSLEEQLAQVTDQRDAAELERDHAEALVDVLVQERADLIGKVARLQSVVDAAKAWEATDRRIEGADEKALHVLAGVIIDYDKAEQDVRVAKTAKGWIEAPGRGLEAVQS